MIFGLREMPTFITVAVMLAANLQVRMLLLLSNNIYTFINFVSLVIRNTHFPAVCLSGIIIVIIVWNARHVYSDSFFVDILMTIRFNYYNNRSRRYHASQSLFVGCNQWGS